MPRTKKHNCLLAWKLPRSISEAACVHPSPAGPFAASAIRCCTNVSNTLHLLQRLLLVMATKCAELSEGLKI